MAENNCFFHNRMDYGFMTDYRPNSDVVSELHHLLVKNFNK